jgi:hypothetical protein
MEKLRSTLAQYSRWQGLSMYVDRMEGNLETDFSLSVENAKALLESIGKEICDAKGMPLGNSPSINAVLKKAFVALGYTAEEMVTQVSASLANIGQLIGNLRNEISPTSHGKSLEELKERNNKVDSLTKGFLIDSTLVVAVFLIRAFEERKNTTTLPSVSEAEVISDYENNEDFNNFWDESYGEFTMGDYSYTSSEILFNVDLQAYQAEYKAFMESKEELTEGEA